MGQIEDEAANIPKEYLFGGVNKHRINIDYILIRKERYESFQDRIKGLERTKDALARACDSLQNENERLKAELKELRSKSVLHDSENLRVIRFETDDGQVITQVTPKTSQNENKRETEGNKNFNQSVK